MKNVSKTLAAHLERINELVSRIDEHERKIPQIERDMLLSALRDMYDAVYTLEAEEGTESGERKTENGERGVDMSVLMAEVDEEPVYAADPDLVAQEEQLSQLPSVEEIEGKENEELCEESGEAHESALRAPQELAAHEDVGVPATEQPKTLWEKLNDNKKTSTIAETMVATRTISDVYEVAKQESGERRAENGERSGMPSALSDNPAKRWGRSMTDLPSSGPMISM